MFSNRDCLLQRERAHVFPRASCVKQQQTPATHHIHPSPSNPILITTTTSRASHPPSILLPAHYSCGTGCHPSIDPAPPLRAHPSPSLDSSPTALWHTARPLLGRLFPLRSHRAAAAATRALCLQPRVIAGRHLRHTAASNDLVHAERGWCSCTREEDFAGQNPLLPETCSTLHRHRCRNTRASREDSRSF